MLRAPRVERVVHEDGAIEEAIVVGFDRRIAEVDVDSLDYPPTDTLPVGVEGGERYGGVRNRQQLRRPVTDKP